MDYYFDMALTHAIVDALLEFPEKMKKSEPNYMKRLAERVPAQLQSFSDRFEDAKLKNMRLSSAFIHQSPRVVFKTGEGCEAGDVLIVVRRKRKGVVEYNSLLLQAKVIRSNLKLEYTPSNSYAKGDKLQYKLYSEWPKFDINIRSRCQGKESCRKVSYDITHKSAHSGAKYLFINEFAFPLIECCAVNVSSVDRTMSVLHHSFKKELYDVISFNSGRRINDVVHKDNDEWSKFVWDVVAHVLNKEYKYEKKGLNGKKRVFGDLETMMFLTKEYLQDAEPCDSKNYFWLLCVDIPSEEKE